jgi:hypothetical protein
MLNHQEYEGEVDLDAPFRSALPSVRTWREVEAVLRQARALLGEAMWQSLLSKAMQKP